MLKKLRIDLKPQKNDFVFQAFIIKTCSISAQPQKGSNAIKMLHLTFPSPNSTQLGETEYIQKCTYLPNCDHLGVNYQFLNQ